MRRRFHLTLSATGVLLFARLAVAGPIVINEIHYDPPDKTEPLEFVELYNQSAEAIDLSGWFFADGIRYTFPPGTVLDPREYVIVAEEPTALEAAYGLSGVLGPWTGKLQNSGERIALRTDIGALADEVNYRSRFPWPIAPRGRGSSMELIHPRLDNDLGGSWRASGVPSGPPVERIYFIAAGDSAWHYRRGVSEASSPVSAWRQWSFAEDDSWLVGQTTIGYGDGDDQTVLNDMQGNYSTVYLRRTFTIASESDIPAVLQLRVYFDDGCIAWINGAEVGRFSVSGGEKSYNDFAVNHEAAWDAVVIDNPGSILRVGVNVLAIHVLNQSLSSSDLSINAELFVPGSRDFEERGVPSPNAENSVYATNAPPRIRQVRHTPLQPVAGERPVVTVKVTDPHGVQSVSLQYQVVVPGAYIPAFLPLPHDTLLADPERDREPNPDFEDAANWTAVDMLDDGAGADAAAGDDIYSVELPGQVNRALVRYRIRTRDAQDVEVRVPYPDDRSLNFAYYVYNGVPPYRADTRSVLGAGHVHSSEILTRLPVYHVVTRAVDLTECIAYSSSFQIPKSNEGARDKFNWECAFVYEGIVYDHIRYRLRQANDRYGGSGKRSMRFRFNKGNRLQARDNYGRKFPRKWRTLNTGKMFDNKRVGNFGITEAMNADLWNMMGVPAPWFFTFHLRVVDGPEEAPVGVNGQYFGDFWGMFSGIEDYDSRFLDTHDMEDGTLYKLKDGQFDGEELRRNQGPFAVTTDADFQNIRANLRPERSITWLNNHVNYDRWYPYHAVVEGIRHYDFRPADSHSKNRSWYFEPDYSGTPFGRLWTLPWDSDASWGPNWNSGVDYSKNAIFANGGKPTFKQEYRNVIREFRDLVWTQAVLNRMIDDLAGFVRDFSHADRDRWRSAPPAAGSQDFGPLSTKVRDMKNFAFVSWSGSTGPDVPQGGRAKHLDDLANAEGDLTSIPRTPSVTSTSPAGFPADALTFSSSVFSDPQGAGTFRAMQWRLGAVSEAGAAFDPSEPRRYEVPAVWKSPELTSFSSSIRIPPDVVEPGQRYRVRVRMKDHSERWSHWSPPAEFTAGEPAQAFPAQAYLRVTEIMFNPPQGTDFEWLEMQNIGFRPIDLTHVHVNDGIEFSFATSAVSELAPGEYVVIVNSLATFSRRYDTEAMNIAGEYAGRLDNAGEKIRVMFGAAFTVQEFTYEEFWYPSADGGGRSLVMMEPTGPLESWSEGAAWRPSAKDGGSPGAPDPASSAGGLQRVGDGNQNGVVEIADAVALLRHLFGSGVPLPCQGTTIQDDDNVAVLDVNGDGAVDISDVVYLLNYLFENGPPPDAGEHCVRVEGCPDACRF